MHKFALHKNIYSSSKIQFYNLIIDGIDQFHAFEEGLETQYNSEFKSLASSISQLCDNRNLPHGKRRKIRGLKKCVELISKNHRLYYIALPEHSLIICLGGTKKNQKKDINKVKSLRKQLLKQIIDYGNLEIKPQIN